MSALEQQQLGFFHTDEKNRHITAVMLERGGGYAVHHHDVPPEAGKPADESLRQAFTHHYGDKGLMIADDKVPHHFNALAVLREDIDHNLDATPGMLHIDNPDVLDDLTAPYEDKLLDLHTDTMASTYSCMKKFAANQQDIAQEARLRVSHALQAEEQHLEQTKQALLEANPHLERDVDTPDMFTPDMGDDDRAR